MLPFFFVEVAHNTPHLTPYHWQISHAQDIGRVPVVGRLFLFGIREQADLASTLVLAADGGGARDEQEGGEEIFHRGEGSSDGVDAGVVE